MLENLLYLDVQVLTWIHTNMHGGFLDQAMPVLRNKYVWIPLYVFIIAFMVMNFKTKGWIWVLLVFFTIGLSDQMSSNVIKHSVKRLRPCHNEQVQANVDLLIPCGGRYSFTSSHATNHFALAFFIFFTVGRVFRRIKLPVVIWAALVSFAQVYVGVHYPLDILGGALLGSLIGWLVSLYFNWRWPLNYIPTPAAENLNNNTTNELN